MLFVKRGLLWDWELGQSREERVFSDVIREQEAETDFQIDLTQHLCFQSGNPLSNAHFNCVEKELTHFLYPMGIMRSLCSIVWTYVGLKRPRREGKRKTKQVHCNSNMSCVTSSHTSSLPPPTAILSDWGLNYICLQTAFSDCLFSTKTDHLEFLIWLQTLVFVYNVNWLVLPL